MISHTPARRAIQGFTLVESLVVAAILAIIAVAIGNVSFSLFRNQDSIKELQIRTGLMQACAEQVLGFRKSNESGYESVSSDVSVTVAPFNSTQCGGMTVPTGFTISAVVVEDYSGAACPTNGICKTVTISSGSVTPLTLMLVNY